MGVLGNPVVLPLWGQGHLFYADELDFRPSKSNGNGFFDQWIRRRKINVYKIRRSLQPPHVMLVRPRGLKDTNSSSSKLIPVLEAWSFPCPNILQRSPVTADDRALAKIDKHAYFVFNIAFSSNFLFWPSSLPQLSQKLWCFQKGQIFGIKNTEVKNPIAIKINQNN